MRLYLTNRVSPACPASIGPHVPAPYRLLEPCLAAARPLPVDSWLRRCPAASSLLFETPLLLCPIASCLRRPTRVQDGRQACPAAVLVLLGIRLQPAASAATRSSSPPLPGGSAPNPDRLRPRYPSRVWNTSRWLVPGNTTSRGCPAAVPERHPDLRSLPGTGRFRSGQYLERPGRELAGGVEWLPRRTPGRAMRNQAEGEHRRDPGVVPKHALMGRSQHHSREFVRILHPS